METYHFKRVVTHYFHLQADSLEEARSALKEEPERFQEGYENVRWYSMPSPLSKRGR